MLSQAEIAIRQPAYCAFDFFRRYVPGFEHALFLEVAPKIGIRETRRIVGDYLLTEEDVRSSRRFPDSIGVSRCAIDIHEPGGEKGVMIGVGDGYDIPYRCLLPRRIDRLLVAGRCVSADHVAHASTRNTPACGITGQAAGLSAALAANRAVSPRALDVAELQKLLKDQGIPLRP